MLRTFILVVAAAAALAGAPAHAGQKVEYSGADAAGTIVVQTGERALYLVTGKGQAIRYPVGVGRAGQQWFGRTRIVSKHIKPAWKPPESIRGRRSPDFFIESGSPRNPMGAAALVLADNELAIHGTNNPGSIGGYVSAGCIRMHNRDIMDLFGRVGVGTRVVFLKGAAAPTESARAIKLPVKETVGATAAAPVKPPAEAAAVTAPAKPTAELPAATPPLKSTTGSSGGSTSADAAAEVPH